MNEREVFIEALQCGDPADRSSRVVELCAGDESLRLRVESLLAAYGNAASFLEAPAAAIVTMDQPITEQLGALIGPYKLLEQIGEGGMGVVFMADQQTPVRRRVALKIIKPGMDTRQVIARFEAERQALALMDHPNIAHVLDAGATDFGRPYFAMELVRGVPITDYCDADNLSIPDRLALFVQICHAVQHAHQKGVIHRDIKPSNVLVTLHDGQPVPKVIDFGVAKATNQQLTERTLFTNFAQMIGTPLYMSPEQAEMSGLDVDTRSDIYSLGVLLYELLTGTTPFDRARIREAAYDEVRRIIREEEPRKPSALVSTLGRTRTAVAAHRKVDAYRFAQLLRGDLDWIVMKALEKNRTRRYQTANDLARDVERYLRHEPVEARPPSASYRFRKLARRNRVVLTTATLVSTALVVGTIVSTWQAIRATRSERVAEAARADEAQQRRIAEDQRNAANAARAAEAQQRKVAEDQRNDAEKRRAQAEANFQKAHWAMHYYITSLNDNKQLKVSALQPLRKELLESALTYYRQLMDQYVDDPAVQPQLAEAYVRVGNLAADTIGSRERAFAALEKGTELFERLAQENPTVDTIREGLAVAYHDLGGAQRDMGRLAEAEVSYQRGREIYEKLAAENPRDSSLQAGLARALLNFDTGQNAARWPTDAEASLVRGLEIFEKLVRQAPGDSHYRGGLAGASYELGHLQRMTGRLADAQASYQRTLEIDEQLVRENPAEAGYSAALAHALHYLGSVQRMAGRWADAQTSCQRALEIYANLVCENPGRASYRMDAARAYFHFGVLQSITGRRDEAVQSWTEAATCYAATADLGDTAPQVLSELGDTLAILGKWQEAADASARAVELSNHAWQPMFQWALLQLAAGDEVGYRATCADLVARHGQTANGAEAAGIAMACMAGERAVDDMEDVLAIAQRAAASDPRNPVYQTLVGAAQFRAGQTSDAIATLKQTLPRLAFAELAAPKQLDPIRVSRLIAETMLGLAYREQQDHEALAKQLQVLQSLVEKLESTAPQYSEGFDRWALPCAIHLTTRQLAELEVRKDP